MKIDVGGELLYFRKATEEEREKMWQEWEEEPYVMYTFYFVKRRESFEKGYPHAYEFLQKRKKLRKSEENLLKKYAKKTFPREKQQEQKFRALLQSAPLEALEKTYPHVKEFMEKYEGIWDSEETLVKKYAKKTFPERKDRREVFDKLISNVVHEDENYVVMNNVVVSAPKFGVHPNYGENIGKSILAEELGGHYICQTLQLRKFEMDIEDYYANLDREIDLPQIVTDLMKPTTVEDLADALRIDPKEKKLLDEARKAQTLSFYYGCRPSVMRYLPDDVEMKWQDVYQTLEAGAGYMRTKMAEKHMGKRRAAETFMGVGKADPLYIRLEEKLKKSFMKKGMSEEEAGKYATKWVVGKHIETMYPTKNLLWRDVHDYESEIEKYYRKEVKRNQRDSFIAIGTIVGLSLASMNPYLIAASKLGVGMAPISLSMGLGVRTMRRLPGRLKRSLEDSDRPSAKKLLYAGGRVKGVVKRPFSYAGRRMKENKYMVKAGRGFKSGAKKTGSGMKKGMKKMGSGVKWGFDKMYFWKKDEKVVKVKEGLVRRIDTKFNKVTNNRWAKVKKFFNSKIRAFDDLYMKGLVPLPKGRVLDLYGYGDNAWVKRKFTKERVRESYGELEGYLEDIGVSKELLEEFGKHRDKVEIMGDIKEIGTARGIMKRAPKYMFNEVGELLTLSDKREEGQTGKRKKSARNGP